MRKILGFVLVFICIAMASRSGVAQSGAASPKIDGFERMTLHAHNCFPEGDHWTDRLDRALGTKVLPIAIEQDVAYYVDPATGKGRSLLAHGTTLNGTEPSLDDYFFTRIKPIMERAIADNRRDTWPVVYLHFNIRGNDPAHLQYIWNQLGKYQNWLTTAEKGADENKVMPLTKGPLMVLTEGGQEDVFYNQVPVGGRLRVFGTMPSGRPATPDGEISPEMLIPAKATNYARWMNFPWAVVERGGQPNAGDWTPADAARLRALVDRAHAMNLAIRFYTLNGHVPAEGQGWSAGYNFGSLEAARTRWRAAINAGVDLLATDQYELLAAEMKAAR